MYQCPLLCPLPVLPEGPAQQASKSPISTTNYTELQKTKGRLSPNAQPYQIYNTYFLLQQYRSKRAVTFYRCHKLLLVSCQMASWKEPSLVCCHISLGLVYPEHRLTRHVECYQNRDSWKVQAASRQCSLLGGPEIHSACYESCCEAACFCACHRTRVM